MSSLPLLTQSRLSSSSTSSLRPSSLKRKASTGLPPDLTHAVQDNATQALTSHTQQHASIKEISSIYEQTYLDTITEIKRLLQYYAFVLAADANPDINLDGEANSNANAEANAVAMQDAKTELKAILDDLASKPELVAMEDVRKVLMDCGIVVDVRQGREGEEEVDVRLI